MCNWKAIVADALFKLQRFQEAQAVVERALMIPMDSPASEVDSLPGETPNPVSDKDTEFSLLLSILNCEISISEGKNPLTQLHTLLKELGSQSLMNTDLVFRIQKDICLQLLKNRNYALHKDKDKMIMRRCVVISMTGLMN